MTKATKPLAPATTQGNSPPIETLSRDEVAAALLAMLGGSEIIPPRWQLKAIVAAKADPGPCSLVAEILAHAVLNCINASPLTPSTREIGRAIDTAIGEIEDALGCCLMASTIKGARLQSLNRGSCQCYTRAHQPEPMDATAGPNRGHRCAMSDHLEKLLSEPTD